jgi:hypothetical protein
MAWRGDAALACKGDVQAHDARVQNAAADAQAARATFGFLFEVRIGFNFSV